MKILHRLVIVCLAAGCATSAAAENAYPALYSFNDLYRLTVNGAAGEPFAASLPSTEPHQLRVATEASVAAPSEVSFTVTPVPGGRPWMLLLAGLAAAAWVAHRRLTRPL
jgi:MYXO-CTERM domain-containing protein